MQITFQRDRLANGTFAPYDPVDHLTQTRPCTVCKRVRPLSSFYSNNGVPYSRCKCCLQRLRGTHQQFWNIEGFSWCKRCKKMRSCDDFRQYRTHDKPVFKKECVICTKERKHLAKVVTRKQNSERGITEYSKLSHKSRRNMVLRRYGITQSDFDRMLNAQNGLCYICREPNKAKYNFHVDHNHTTGQVRKLLCHRCNNGLRYIEDKGFLLKGLAYLSEHNEEKRTIQ